MISQIIDGLTKLLGPIATAGKDRRELKDSALRAISIALDETCIYYRDLEKGAKRSLDREGALVKYWSAAAIPLRHFNRQLAEICDLKAEHWLNPESYSKNEIQQLGIALSDVRQAYRKMLNPRPFGSWKSKWIDTQS